MSDHAEIWQELHDRFRGTLLGVAIGDALGAPFEGRTHLPDGCGSS